MAQFIRSDVAGKMEKSLRHRQAIKTYWCIHETYQSYIAMAQEATYLHREIRLIISSSQIRSSENFAQINITTYARSIARWMHALVLSRLERIPVKCQGFNIDVQ
jgi:hypothetical protein